MNEDSALAENVFSALADEDAASRGPTIPIVGGSSSSTAGRSCPPPNPDRPHPQTRRRRHRPLHRHAPDKWTVPDFRPMDWIPDGARLTAHSDRAGDVPALVLQRIIHGIAPGRASHPPIHLHGGPEQAVKTHPDMEADQGISKKDVGFRHADPPIVG